MTTTDRINRDRREKWRAYREKNGIPPDAPFQGKDPWEECYEEMLDALNYLDQVQPKCQCESDALEHSKLLVDAAARHCLRHMEDGQ